MKRLLILAVTVVIGFLIGFYIADSIIRHLKPPPSSGTAINVDPMIPEGFDDEKPPVYVEAPPNHPPAIIKAGPYHWRVRYVKFGSGEFARTYYKTLEIQLDPTLPVDQLKETLIHELIHSCIFVGNRGTSRGDMTDDDQYIEATAPTLLQIFRDNPELIVWLQK